MGSDPMATLPQEHFLLHQLQAPKTYFGHFRTEKAHLLTIPIHFQSLATGRLVLVLGGNGDEQRRKSFAEKLLAGF